MSPAVGSPVHFRRFGPGEQPEAAIVTFVHSDTLVNLAVFNANGGVMGFTGVAFGPTPAGEYAEWPSSPITGHAPAPLEANGPFQVADPQESST